MANRQRREHWQNVERHYCSICNAWMGSDRQSIMLHENGKKHLEQQENALQQKRKDKQKEELDQKTLQSSLQMMEQAAAQAQAHAQPLRHLSTPSMPNSVPLFHRPANRPPPLPPPLPPPSRTDEKRQWESRKKQRRGEEEENDTTKPIAKRPKIEPGQGTYELAGKAYLEGTTFHALLEEEMPVQLWIGAITATSEEKRLPDREMYWNDALVASIRATTAHISYLASLEAQDETMEKNVDFERIRIVLGADPSIPETLEEARLMANGGEELVLAEEKATVDETTGLTGWSTVTVKRTTARQEIKEDRARQREKRKQTLAAQEAKEKEAMARKMEEAKVANADDSALGAYDVWGTGGYKGVDIAREADAGISVADTAKSLAHSKPVAFKKKKKKSPSNRNPRTTTTDDD